MGKVCRDGNILPVGPSPKSVVYNRNRVSIVAKSLLCVLAFVFLYAGAWAQTQTVYKKVSSITNGRKYLIVNANDVGSAHALSYTLSGNNASVADDAVNVKAAIAGTDNANYILASDVEAKSVWTANSGYTFKNGNYYINRDYNYYLKINNNSASWTYNNGIYCYDSYNRVNWFVYYYNSVWDLYYNSGSGGVLPVYLYEQKTVSLYTVTYYSNNATSGSVPVDGNRYMYGARVTVLGNTGNLLRTGYVFAGWNTAADGSGTTYAPGSSATMPDGNLKLYAKWVPTYTVSYNANGADSGTAPPDPNSPYVSGSTVTVLGNTGTLVKDGYVFTGWNTLANGNGTHYNEGGTFNISANTTLYADWKLACNVTYNANGGTGTMADWNSPYASGSTVTVMSSMFEPPAGRYLVSWNTVANGSGTSYAPGATFTITGDVTLYAQWSSCSALSYPFCIDFEDYATPNGQYYYDAGMPDCWSRIYTGTYIDGKPHVYNDITPANTSENKNLARDGNGIVITSGNYRYYNEDFGATNYVVTPQITGLTGGDVVSFNAWWQYVEYGELTLGYMTNPADASTFVEIGVATPFLYRFGTANTGISRIALPAGIPSSAYLAFRWHCPTEYYSYSVVIDNICICQSVAGTFEFTTTSGTVSVMSPLNLSASPYLNNTITAPGYVEYASSNDDVAVVNSTTGELIGMSEGTAEITATFVPNDGNKCRRYATFTVSVVDLCVNVSEGGSNETFEAPVNNYYNYTYTQILYDNNEISAGTIMAIGFEYASATPMTNKGTVKIYMKHTTKTGFTNNRDWVTGLTEADLVYSGDLNCEIGWNTFQLTTPFVYNGTQNLLVVVDDNSGSYNGSSYTFRYTETATNTVISYYGDGNQHNIDNSNVGSKTSDFYNKKRPNTKFCIYSGTLHTLSYNTTDNCTGVASNIASTYGVNGQTVLVADEEPTCSNGIFVLWKDENGLPYTASSTITFPDHDITLYAQYKGCDYVAVTRVDGGAGQGVDDGLLDSDGVQKFNVCTGSELRLRASKKTGVGANITTYSWEINRHDGSTHVTQTGETMSYTVNNTMGQDIVLTIDADDGCKEKIPLRVWASHGLTAASGASAGEICVGSGKEIVVGDPAVVPASIIEVDNENIEIKSSKGESRTTFIPDGVGECYTSDVVFSDFREDVVITHATNIDYVRINMEHSHMGDVQISLKCHTPPTPGHPAGIEKTAVLLQDSYPLYKSDGVTPSGAKDDAAYDWPYEVIRCKALYYLYSNSYEEGVGCGMGEYDGEYVMNTYVIKNDGGYYATGVRQEATSFNAGLSTSEKLTHLQGMIESGNTPETYCFGDYYCVFKEWVHNADYYNEGNYYPYTEMNSDQWGTDAASLGFGSPNLLDALFDDDNIIDYHHNQAGEGLDYCWSNSESYQYASGDGTVIETVNHMDGYTNGKIVKPSDFANGTNFYHPYNSFQSLVGCKLNGIWTLQICDSWGLDNGYVFSWEIGLKDIDDNAWSYDVELVNSEICATDNCCGGFDVSDRTNRENLISEEGGTNFFIHPTLQNISINNVVIGEERSCALTLTDNVGCQTSGNGFTYTIVQPTVPHFAESPVQICLGEQAHVEASLAGTISSGSQSMFKWWSKPYGASEWTVLDLGVDGGGNPIPNPVEGVTSAEFYYTPDHALDEFRAEIYDANGCGGIIDDIIQVNTPEIDPTPYDYIWRGAASTDWNIPSNWYIYNSGHYSVASNVEGLPTTSSNVYVGPSQCTNRGSGAGWPIQTGVANAFNLTIANGASLTVPSGKTLNIAGNLDNIGTLSATSGTIIFCGPSPNGGDQAISNNITFGNVTFNNQGGDIRPSGSVTINGAATFTDGVVYRDVTFGSSATATANTYNSFVDGTVTKSGSANGFTFPTGNNGVLGKVAAASDVSGVTVRYLNNPAGFGLAEYPRWWNINDMCSGNNPQFDHVSNFEYWDIGTTGSLTATLTVLSADSVAHFNSVSPTHNGGDVFGAFWNGNCWENIGGVDHSVSDNPYGTITVGVTIPATRAYSKIVSLGSKNHSTVLPIELTALTATCDGRSSLVEWTTASERNNDYFSLERSDDAINFTEVARIAGAGNSIEPLSYSYTDYGVRGGDNYYRLVQVDYDGTRTASEIVVANCIDMPTEEPEVLAYPNPFSGDLTVELENFGNQPARIDVYDVLGRLVYTEDVDAPQNNYQTVLHLGDLPEATYTVRVGTATFVINRKVVKN